jgi:hypothetical protein
MKQFLIQRATEKSYISSIYPNSVSHTKDPDDAIKTESFSQAKAMGDYASTKNGDDYVIVCREVKFTVVDEVPANNGEE